MGKHMVGFDDVVFRYLVPKLTLKELARLRCVSKFWNHLLTSSPNIFSFSEQRVVGVLVSSMSTDRTKMEFYSTIFKDVHTGEGNNLKKIHAINRQFSNDFRVSPPCNGLVLVTHSAPDKSSDQEVLVCNPFSYKDTTTILPSLGIPESSTYISRSYGLCFDMQSQQHKLVCLSSYVSKQTSTCDILTIGDENMTWRRKCGTVPFKFIYSVPGKLINGSLYWVAFEHNNENLSSSKCIVSFDAHEEKFSVVPLPPCCSTKLGNVWMGELGGCLVHTHHDTSQSFDIWIQVYNSYDRNITWSKKYTVRCQPLHRRSQHLLTPLAIVNDEVLIKWLGNTTSDDVLLWYDIYLEKFTTFRLNGDLNFIYGDSLVCTFSRNDFLARYNWIYKTKQQ